MRNDNRLFVDEMRAAFCQRLGVEFDTVAIDIEGLALGVIPEDTPRHEYLAVGLSDGHDTTVQFLCTQIGIVVSRLCECCCQ